MWHAREKMCPQSSTYMHSLVIMYSCCPTPSGPPLLSLLYSHDSCLQTRLRPCSAGNVYHHPAAAVESLSLFRLLSSTRADCTSKYRHLVISLDSEQWWECDSWEWVSEWVSEWMSEELLLLGGGTHYLLNMVWALSVDSYHENRAVIIVGGRRGWGNKST